MQLINLQERIYASELIQIHGLLGQFKIYHYIWRKILVQSIAGCNFMNVMQFRLTALRIIGDLALY